MPKVATAFHPLLRPLFKPRQRAMREEVARNRLERIRELFITSRDGRKEDRFKLWIRGQEVGHGERVLGFTGHFYIFQLVQDPDGWRIAIAKELQPLDAHPERARPKNVGMPNWGHPVLRSAKKERVFHSLEEANIHVKMLLDEFPKAAKLKHLSVRVRVYSKHPEHGPVLEPIIMKMTPHEDGTCTLSYMPDPRSRISKLNEEEGIQGSFTKKVVLAQGKPKPKKVNHGKLRLERLRNERANLVGVTPEGEKPE